jgi:DNA-binding response OmpR family regulator
MVFLEASRQSPTRYLMNVPTSAPLLLVEDDLDMAGNIGDYLDRRGWRVHHAANGALALHLLLETKFAAVVLDRGLPGIDGLELCRRLRDGVAQDLPVLMLTAADALDDRLAGFSSGVDDYVVKPFALPELHARLTSLVRRSEGRRAAAGELLRCADLEMNLGTRVVARAGRAVPLTNMGYAILEILMRRSPEVVRREDIEQTLWGEMPPSSDALRTHVFALRAAIDGDAKQPLLWTHRGIGYQLEARYPASSRA